MEERENAPVEQTNEASGDNGKQDSVSYDSYHKVLKEKKSFQERLSKQEEALKELQMLKEEKMKQEGKIQELLESKSKEANEWKSKFEETKQQYAWNALTSGIKAHASKHNCKDPEGFIKLLEDEDLKRIRVNDDFTIDGESIETVISDYKKKKDYLFSDKAPKAVSGTPRNTEYKKEEKSMGEMTMDELRRKFKETYK